jgi:arylsulfatase A-like enzyme
LFDDYTTRGDALRQQKQSVFRDLTRRDLKLEPPPELQGREREQWLSGKPTEVEIEVDGRKLTLTGEALGRWKYQRYMQDYLACVQSVDDSVGRILDWLDTHGLGQDTVVIYTSDQGFFLGDHGLYDKRFMYEESIRMPLLVRWPNGIKPGRVNRLLVTNCDFAPTFVDFAGLVRPDGMQGLSLVPAFLEKTTWYWRKSFYYRYYHDPGHHDTRAHYGVRTDTHKLIRFPGLDQWECFDLEKDPQELRNIYSDPGEQKIVKRLKKELERVRKEVDDRDEFVGELPSDGVDGPPPRWKPGFEPQTDRANQSR